MGLEGYVVHETKHQMVIVSESGAAKIVPKLGTVFTLMISGKSVLLFGNQLGLTPSDRIVKKFKPIKSIDL